MAAPETTDWQDLRAAAQDDTAARGRFVTRYQELVRTRLRRALYPTLLANDLEDAVQDVFVECFRHGGVLAIADPDRIGGFRAFLHGVIDNVACRLHEKEAIRHKHVPHHLEDHPSAPPIANQATPSHAIDREWALRMLRRAAEHMRLRAARLSVNAQRRIELLELRFQQGLPIRAIAERWQVDADVLHRQYAKARREFYRALLIIVAAGRRPTLPAVRAECEQLLQLLAPS